MKNLKEEYQNEEEFLKNYDSSQYEKLSLTADILLFSVSDGIKENYRKLNEKYFSILLVKRNGYPFKDKWCLPGGFVEMKESIDEAAIRILASETNLHNIYMEQLYTFGSVDRDPRMRIISTTYMALVDKNKLLEHISDKASWFHVTMIEDETETKIILDNGTETITFNVKKTLISKTTERYQYQITKNDALAFDHAEVIITGIERLKNKVNYTDIVFHMMPEYFTLGELQQVYEILLRKKLLDPAFRRMIGRKVEKTKKMKTGEGHRPSVLFRYKGGKS